MVPQTTSPVLSVYLVEDSDLLASRIRKALENEPGVHVVGRSADAQDAIAAITELEPDLAIIDLSLRQGTGFDILRALSDPASAPPCIVLTNHSSPAYRRAAEQFGVSRDRFFDKIEQMASFTAMIRELAQQRLASVETGEASDGREYHEANRQRSGQGAGRARRA